MAGLHTMAWLHLTQQGYTAFMHLERAPSRQLKAHEKWIAG